MADNRLAYGIAKGLGIDTTEMSPKEVWEAIAKKKGVSVEQAQKQADGNESKDGSRNVVEKLHTLTKTKRKNMSPKSKDEFYGVEYKGVKGEDAIEKLLQERQGHVKNAFERKEVGGIDLVWGDDNAGLLHTIQRREEMYRNGDGTIRGLDMVRKIPEIVEKGQFGVDKKGRPFIDFSKYRVGIKPTYDGEKLNWIVSAMEKIEKAPE